MDEVMLYTDGACLGNPGPGGWAYILRHAGTGKERRESGGSSETTNNRMELTAVIEGLEALKRPCIVRVYCDSQYIVRGMNEWIGDWCRRGWKTADKKPVRNEDLWRKLLELSDKHQISFEHIRGHRGHAENEWCDRKARDAASRFRDEISRHENSEIS
jgi:ribonuclease HI